MDAANGSTTVSIAFRSSLHKTTCATSSADPLLTPQRRSRRVEANAMRGDAPDRADARGSPEGVAAPRVSRLDVESAAEHRHSGGPALVLGEPSASARAARELR